MILRLELVRMLRDPRFTALGVLAPIGFYLLFATLFGGQPTKPGELKGTVEIMVAMSAYGGIWAVLSSTAPRIAQERETGWLPSNRLADLGWRIAGHHTIPAATVTILAGWTVVLAILAVLAYRRPRLRGPWGTAGAARTMPA